jgi:hypothetical protein
MKHTAADNLPSQKKKLSVNNPKSFKNRLNMKLLGEQFTKDKQVIGYL